MRLRWAPTALAFLLVIAGCGSGDTGTAATVSLTVSPQNTTYVVGVNRVSLVLLDQAQKPVTGAAASFDLAGGEGAFETRPLENVGSQYGSIPVYVGAARLPQVGQYRLTVHATLAGGQKASGDAVITVAAAPPEVAVGAKVPAVEQHLASDPGVKLSQIDSGVPPDDWHSATVAAGLAQHKPMVLYFGEPGFCRSRTCQPTVLVLQQVCAQYCDRLLFEHIENNYPAGPDGPNGPTNPAFNAFGLQTEPWIFFVTADGRVADRFEGPVTASELKAAAEGTLAGKVPAVDIPLGS